MEDQAQLLSQALAELEAGNFSAAFQSVERAKLSGAPVPNLAFIEALCLLRLGRTAEGQAALRAELAAFPGNSAARKLFEDLRLEEPLLFNPSPQIQSSGAAQIVNQFWSRVNCTESERNFYCFPPLRNHFCELIFGVPRGERADWCEFWTFEKYFKDRVPFESALSVCCGFGRAERVLSRLGAAKQIHGVDIASGAIAHARQTANAEGITNITYAEADLNKERLPTATYDLVWANGALHHIEQLEFVIPNLYESLRSGGVLVATEYVGPKYQQVGERQAELINAVRHLLPPELKLPSGGSREQELFGRIWHNKTVDWFLKNDPSESVRGNEVIEVLRRVFERVDVLPFNGSLLFYALDERFFENYSDQNPRHVELLKALFQLEDSFVKSGELQSDNVHLICWKK